MNKQEIIREVIRVNVLNATDTSMTIDEATDAIRNELNELGVVIKVNDHYEELIDV